MSKMIVFISGALLDSIMPIPKTNADGLLIIYTLKKIFYGISKSNNYS